MLFFFCSTHINPVSLKKANQVNTPIYVLKYNAFDLPPNEDQQLSTQVKKYMLNK